MEDLPVNQIETGDSNSTANADAENLSETVQTEQPQHQDSTEQISSLEKLVETMVEEQKTLRKNNDELLIKNHDLEASLQQVQGVADVAFYFSVASLIISILIATFIILRNKLTKIFEPSQEIQQLKLMIEQLSVENEKQKTKISELSQEIQQHNLMVEKTPVVKENTIDKNPFCSAQSVQSTPPFPSQTTNASFKDEFNTLMSLKESSIFSTELAIFIKKYKVKAFSCSNSQELIQDSNVAPKFKESSADDRADYWAYENGDSYEVVPSPYVQSYNDSVNVGRAFGKVFESNFKDGGYLTDIQVTRPALFKKSGVQWILHSRGKLILR